MAARTCPFCGAALKAEILGGLCPKCVLGKAMAEPADGGKVSEDRGQRSATQSPLATEGGE